MLSKAQIFDFIENVGHIKADIEYSKQPNRILLENNKEFKNIWNGKDCFVVGNGPSLKRQNLNLLSNKNVITVNLITKSESFKYMNPQFHFWNDERFFYEDVADNTFLKSMQDINTETNHPYVFCPLSSVDFIKRHKMDKILNVRYFYPYYYFNEGFNKEIDFCKVVPCFETVVQEAIIFAIYAGAKRIYLIGCDCTGAVSYISVQKAKHEESDQLEYAYETTENEKQRMKRMMGHLSNEVFFNGQKEMFSAYRRLFQYCSKRKIEIYNCTSGGILEELPRMKYEDAINKIR